MNCALWLNRRKVRRASEIPENLDVASLASLRGYFLAGSLSEWLLENGGERYAKRLEGLSPDDPALNEKLAAVFGCKADFGKALSPVPREGVKAQTPSPAYSNSVSSFTSSLPSSFTPRNSFRFTEFGSGSFSYEMLMSFGGFWEFLGKLGLFGSFSPTSWSFTSFGKFHEWEWEWLFELYKRWQGGSFTFTTWSFGSFHRWEWEWLLRLYGGSFVSTSFSSFGKGFGSFDVFGILSKNLGSFELRKFLENLKLDEYDRIMFETLMMCPLDRFGYGIHNI